MIICFDIDGTLCTNTDGDYDAAEPFQRAIAEVNKLYADGHEVLLYTARGSTTEIDWSEMTTQQLAGWGVRYHRLYMGKPTADVYIDDKALNAAEWNKAPSQLRAHPKFNAGEE